MNFGGGAGRGSLLFAAFGAVVVLGVAACMWIVHGPLNSVTLFKAVESAADSDTSQGDIGPDTCRRLAPTRWRCEVPDSGGSGGFAIYAVTTGGSCWHARLVRTSGEESPRRVDGCIHLIRV